MSQGPPRGQSAQAGAVLPIALFALLLISLLVASALLTASSELVLSRAHQDGLRSLHSADGALEAFIANGAFVGEEHADRAMHTSASSPDGERFAVTLTALRAGGVEEDSTGLLLRRELFSIVAEPADGRGRVSGALVETIRRARPFKSAIEAAATVGGEAIVSASATLAAPSQVGSSCTELESPLALDLSAGAFVSGAGAASLTGNVRRDTLAWPALAERSLSGSDFTELSQGAEHYFGAHYSEAAFSRSFGPRYDAAAAEYRWGCPVSLVSGCPQEAVAEAPVIVIDAAGSEVLLDSGHGQGVLIVRGGGARLAGDFRFAGLVLVEGRLRVDGGAQIMGAVVVGDDLILGSSGGSDSSIPAIVFDGCSLAVAEWSLSLARLETATQTLDYPTFGWYEVVR